MRKCEAILEIPAVFRGSEEIEGHRQEFSFKSEVTSREKYQGGDGRWEWSNATCRPPPKTHKVIWLQMVSLCTIAQGKAVRGSDGEEATNWVVWGIQKKPIWTSQLHFGMRCGGLMKQRLSYLVIRRGINHGSWRCLEGWWSKIPSFKIQAPIWGCRKKVIFCKKEKEALLNTWFIFCCGARMNARYFPFFGCIFCITFSINPSIHLFSILAYSCTQGCRFSVNPKSVHWLCEISKWRFMVFKRK